jgi:hypothetical protein
MYFIPYLEFGVEGLVCPLKLYEYVQFQLHISTMLLFHAGILLLTRDFIVGVLWDSLCRYIFSGDDIPTQIWLHM